jgi:phage-related minor tail protein
MSALENRDASASNIIENNNPDSVPELKAKIELLTKQYETLLKKVDHIMNNIEAEGIEA